MMRTFIPIFLLFFTVQHALALDIRISFSSTTLISPSDTVLCKGSTQALFAKASGNIGTINYSWYNSNGQLIGNNSSISTNIISFNHFYLIATDSISADTAEMRAYIYAIKKPQVSLYPNAGCAPLKVELLLTHLSPHIYTYTWLTDEDSTYPLSGSLKNHIYKEGGHFKGILFIKNDLGCSDTIELDPINVFSRPLVSISSKNINTRTIQFNANTDSSVQLKWEFGDGNFSLSTLPVHSYSKDDIYLVTVTGISSMGCKSLDSAWISFMHPGGIWIPNAFSPNKYGTPENTFFKPEGSEIASFKIEIRDRWGVLIFKGNENEAWDGKVEGTDAASSIYFYHIIISDKQGAKTEREGSLTLIR